MHDDVKRQVRPHPLGIVVAMTNAGVIGRDGQLPWDLPEDRRLFRQLTVGGTVIMGRRTFESLPGPLVDRINIVVTRGCHHYHAAETAPDLPTALILARRSNRPTFIIGGVELYREALPVADYLHISWVEGDIPGGRYFPPFDLRQWQALEQRQYSGFRYVIYRRV